MLHNFVVHVRYTLVLFFCSFSVNDEKMIGADLIIAEFRLPLRQVKSYELTHYHVYMEKRVSESIKLGGCTKQTISFRVW